MNELQEFFYSVAKEKKKKEEENIRFTPRVNIDLSTDLSNFFGTVTEAKREHVIIAKRDSTKLDALKGFFDRLDQFENTLAENIEKQNDGFDVDEVKYDVETPAKTDKTESETKQEELEPIVETLHKVKEDTVANVVNVMSGLGFKKEEASPYTDLQKLQLEFRHFKNVVIKQMASIGGGGEVRLLNLDDVDTSSLGNGKFLAYNSTTKKLEFTDQVDGN
tara:strand:+ start:34 stop:693 length:660 start_codon:yes stop_codon:yes gene_type:complete